MKTYPIMLNLRGRMAVVVGAGQVGLRRVRSLLQCGAKVRVISPNDPDTSDVPDVELLGEPYRPELLEGATLVLGCTSDRQLNATIARDARRIGAMVNVADQPDLCDFFLPAVARDDDVVLAVGSGGNAPALAVRLRDSAKNSLPDRIGEFAAVLGELRQRARTLIDDEARRAEIMKRLADQSTYESFIDAGPKAVERAFEEMI